MQHKRPYQKPRADYPLEVEAEPHQREALLEVVEVHLREAGEVLVQKEAELNNPIVEKCQ